MLDNKIKRFPCWDSMISTLGSHPKEEEYVLLERSFGKLFDEQLKYGHIKEEVFDELEFPVDKDAMHYATCRPRRT